jgi:hypothetical protein
MTDTPAHARARDDDPEGGFYAEGANVLMRGGGPDGADDPVASCGAFAIGAGPARRHPGMADTIAAALNRPDGVGRDGIALLVEAAAMLRISEAHHRERAHPWRDGPGKAARLAKADRDGEVAERIEAFLQGAPAASRPFVTLFPPSVDFPTGDPQEGDLWARIVQLVPFKLAVHRFSGSSWIMVVPPGACVGASTRSPAVEGMEESGHRPDCECAVCWPVVHVTGDPLAHDDPAVEAVRALFEPNPDRIGADPSRESVHRSSRGEGFNTVD